MWIDHGVKRVLCPPTHSRRLGGYRGCPCSPERSHASGVGTPHSRRSYGATLAPSSSSQALSAREGTPVQGRKHGALWVATRSRAIFFGRGGFHCVILRQADKFLDTPSELRDPRGSDIEEAGVFEMLVRLHQGMGRHDGRCGRINDDLNPRSAYSCTEISSAPAMTRSGTSWPSSEDGRVRAGHVAASVDGGRAQRLHHARRQRVIGSRRNDRLTTLQPLMQALPD